MVSVDLQGKTALITGGTQGIGLASALALARAGARVFVTYKWGSADLEKVAGEFAAQGAMPPVFCQADVAEEQDTGRLMEELAAAAPRIDIFISNVSFALQTPDLKDYRKRSLFKTLEYSTWPLIDYTRSIKEHFGGFPRYVLGISSDGPEHFYPGYDFVAASKALMELFARYLSVRLFSEGTRVNVLRFGTVNTESFRAIFGEDFFAYVTKNGVPENALLTTEECGKAVLAMCSGLLDAVNGQIISVDYGLPFRDNYISRYVAEQRGGA